MLLGNDLIEWIGADADRIGLERVRCAVRIRLEQVHVDHLVNEVEERIAGQVFLLAAHVERGKRRAQVIAQAVIEVGAEIVALKIQVGVEAILI